MNALKNSSGGTVVGLTAETSKNNFRGPRPQVARAWTWPAQFLLVLGILLLAWNGAQAQSIRCITAPGKFYVNDKQGAGIVCNYAVYAISNSTSTNFPSVYVAITNLVPTNQIVLTPEDSGLRALGALAPGQTKLAAFYLKGPSFTGNSDTILNANEPHTIQVWNGLPGFGSVLTASNYNFTNIIFVIEALANKVTIITNLNPQAVLGSDVDLVIGGETGTIGGNNSVLFSPGVLTSWRPDAYELVGSIVRFNENGNFTNQMFFDPTISGFTNYTGQTYTNTFRFRAVKVTGTNLPVSPFAFIDSGTGTKHTAVSSLVSGGGSNLIYSATNVIRIVSQTVSPTSLLSPGGTVTYTITFTNESTTPVDLNEIRDTLPGFPGIVTYIPGSASYNASPISDPNITGQLLRWAQPFALPGNSSGTLVFQAAAPLQDGQYTNSVIAILGNDQIDTTIITTDGSPSTSVFTVIPVADVGISKSAPASVFAGSNLNYTITITNLGPSPATSLSVTDSLPANVTFVSASPAAITNGNLVIWPNLGPIAAGTSSNLILTVAPPVFPTTLTNMASGGSPILDPDLTNNVSPPVFTSVSPSADLSLRKLAPPVIAAGVNFNYTLVVSNHGPSLASNLVVSDALAPNLTFVSASNGGQFNAGTVEWSNLGNLAAGGSLTLTLTVTAPLAGGATNSATLSSPTHDPVPTNNVTPPALSVVGNVPPNTVNDVASTLRNVSVTVPVLANDSDDNGDLLTLIGVTQTNGTASVVGNDVQFAPATNFVGSVILTYTVIDGQGGTNTGLVTISVTNRPPVALDDTATTTNGVPQVLLPLANDSDPDGDPLTITNVSTTVGVVSINSGTTNITFTQTNNAVAVITYTISDGFGGTATATITATPANLPPVPGNLNVTTPEDVATNLVLTATDEGTNLVFAILSGPTNGILSGFNAAIGEVTYTPATNYFGADGFTFTVSDGSLLATGVVNIAVTPVNDAPVPAALSITTPEDTATNIVLTTTDDGTNLAYALLNGPSNGTLGTLNTNTGAVTYSPNTNYFGADSFEFTVFDGSLYATGTVSITVTPVNDAPLANDQTITLAEDTTTNLVLTATDLDSTNLTFAILGGPVNGTLGTLNTNMGAVTYSPGSNFAGADGFTFTVFDGSLYATGTVSITVTPLNDAPVAVNDDAAVAEDSTNSIPVLVNDSDIDGDPLTLVSVGTTNGTATIVGTNVVYTPTPDFNGTNVLTYCITDGTVTNCASITVVVNAVNDAPVADNITVTTPEDSSTNLVLTATDVDSSTLTFAILSAPANGSLGVLDSNTGAVTYTPSNNYNGPDVFTFTAFDGALYATGTVSLTITPVNDPPVAVNDNLNMSEDSTNTIPVLVNDSDVDGDPLTLVSVSTTNGTATIVGTNVVYTPAPDFSGTNALTYCITDGVTTNCATITIVVNAVNDRPVANNLLVVTTQGVATNLTVTGSDVDSAVLTYAILTGPANGTLGTLNTNTGAVTYTPSPGYSGPDSFTFTVFDGSLYATGTVSITVSASQFGIRQSANVFNPQTGLYEQTVSVTNLSGSTIAAFQVLVGDFASTNGAPRTNVWLWNAHGTNFDGRRYVQYNSPLDPGSNATVRLEFYNPTRVPFTNSVEVLVTLPASAVTNLSGGVVIERVFTDLRIPGETRFVIEWISIPGRNYTVIYSPSVNGPWTAATPTVTATSTRTQWYDDGPPKTASKPTNSGSRYYRVILNP